MMCREVLEDNPATRQVLALADYPKPPFAAFVPDAVFAPVCLALGFAGRRILPHRWWTPILVASLCTVVLVLLAIPVYAKPGQHLDNLTVLDRDYRTGFWIALAVVWGAALLYLIGDRALPVREDEVVEQQGADHVDAQPPSLGSDRQQGPGGEQPHLER